MSFLISVTRWPAVVLAASIPTAAALVASVDDSFGRASVWVRRGAWTVLIATYGFWTYLAVAFGVLLAWTVPVWGWMGIGLLAVAAGATASRPLHRPRVPASVPLGLFIAVVLSGWVREEERLRCDDYLALAPPVELIVPSHPDLASCRPGEVRRAGRFPRTIWEAPDGRLIFTTQGASIPGGIDGAVCEAHPGQARPHCVGEPRGKSQGLVRMADADRLVAMQWGVRTPSGGKGSVVLEISPSEPIRVVSEHVSEEELAEGFYEPANSTLFMFSDEMDAIYQATMPGFVLGTEIPIEFTPGELHYDTSRGEGVACGNHLGAALRGDPFALRYFVDEGSSLIDRLSVTWGCDWDPTTRKVYTTVPNLGLLTTLDFDSGRVERRSWVGFGMRSVAYDPTRRRVYFTNFLRGYVLALDEATGSIINRWFVGRFSRWVRLTRDGRALLATGNLGIVRIPLEDP